MNINHASLKGDFFSVSYSDPPTILSSAINHTVNESSRTTLRCKANGYPPPKILWSRPSGSQVPLSNNHPMVLLNTSRSQHGRYSCRAHNDEGYSETKVGYLNVQCKFIIKQIKMQCLKNLKELDRQLKDKLGISTLTEKKKIE